MANDSTPPSLTVGQDAVDTLRKIQTAINKPGMWQTQVEDVKSALGEFLLRHGRLD